MARLPGDHGTAIPPGPYYTANQAAERIGVSLRTLARWDTIDEPRGPKRHRLDGMVRYVAAEVDAYAATRRAFMAAHEAQAAR